MKVLVACEESQTVCNAFRERGHEAYSCDIQEPSGGHPEWHILGDAVRALRGGWFCTMDNELHFVDRWDLAICHPPCTYLSNAGACRMYRWFYGERWINSKRYDQMKEGRSFFYKMFNANADRIAVENPLPLKICELPDATQQIQPFEFGEPYSKKTLLWLVNLPKLIPTQILHEHKPYLPSNTHLFSLGAGGSRGVAKTQKQRSKTFVGIANAMADQWGQLCTYKSTGETSANAQMDIWDYQKGECE